MTEAAPAALATLLATLDLESIEVDRFRGRTPAVGWQRIYGGQVIGQALVAAQRTVEATRPVHSLHAYFLRPGDPSWPVLYEVDRIRDGGSFTTRRVLAIQGGQAILSLAASFHGHEDGLDHAVPMPDVPHPDTLPSERELAQILAEKAPDPIRRYWQRERPIELRPIELDHYIARHALPPVQRVWFRATGAVPDDDAVQRAVLAYASDMTLLDTALFPHGRAVFDPTLQVASLDHAIWFHRPTDMARWHLYAQDAPSSGGARGFTRGSIFREDGTLVASVAQEGLIRPRTRQGPKP